MRTLDSSWFKVYSKEAAYLCDFLVRYNKLPNRATFLQQFPAFSIQPASEPPEYYLRAIKDNYIFGVAKRGLTAIVQELKDDKLGGFDLAARMRALTERVTITETSDSVLWSTASGKLSRYAQRKKSDTLFYDLPFNSLRRAVGRRPPENMMVFFARPGVGKTWLACQCAVDGACRQHIRTGLVSFEMSREELEDRCDAIRLNLPWGALNRGSLSFKEEMMYRLGLQSLAKTKAPLFIHSVNDPDFGVPHIESWIVDNQISLLVIDAAHEIYAPIKDKVERGYWLANELKMLCQRRKLFGVFTVQEGRSKKGVGAEELASWSDAWLQKSDLFVRITGDKRKVERVLETLKVRNGAYCTVTFNLCLEPVNIHETISEESYITIGDEG